MTFDEWRILVKGLKSVYTSDRFLPDADAIKLWFKLLQDLEYPAVQAAAQKYILTNKFPPTVADLREMSMDVKQGDQLTWGESWKKFKNAVRVYGIGKEKEALESLDPLTRKVTELFGYKSFCLSDVQNEMADRAHFQRIFETVAKRESENQKLPLSLRQTIAQIQMKGMDGHPLLNDKKGD